MTGISGPKIGRTLNAIGSNSDKDFKWKTLDAAGYKGPLPEFPLPELRVRESQLWEKLWTTPQAIEWSRLDLTLQVAFYVRKCIDNEMPGAKAPDLTIMRQMQDSLGLSLPGMRAHRWRISEDELDDFEDDPLAAASEPDIRDVMTGNA